MSLFAYESELNVFVAAVSNPRASNEDWYAQDGWLVHNFPEQGTVSLLSLELGDTPTTEEFKLWATWLDALHKASREDFLYDFAKRNQDQLHFKIGRVSDSFVSYEHLELSEELLSRWVLAFDWRIDDAYEHEEIQKACNERDIYFIQDFDDRLLCFFIKDVTSDSIKLALERAQYLIAVDAAIKEEKAKVARYYVSTFSPEKNIP